MRLASKLVGWDTEKGKTGGLHRSIPLVAPAVLAGLVAQTLFLDAGELRPFGTWYVAGGIAAVVAWRTRSFGWTLLIGMVSVWLLAALT